jgi:hypothetical protein
MRELNPLIRGVAEQYKFTVLWDGELDKWIIHNANSTFYWSDDEWSHDTFFEDLWDYIYRSGQDSVSGW